MNSMRRVGQLIGPIDAAEAPAVVAGAGHVEALRVGQVAFAPQVPFAKHAGGVAGLFHRFGDRHFFVR